MFSGIMDNFQNHVPHLKMTLFEAVKYPRTFEILKVLSFSTLNILEIFW